VEWGFVRHGSTDWNASGRLQGQTDIELNETGRHQARLLAKRLKHEGWEAVVSSDLKRAYETATIIAEELNFPAVHIDARLRERTHGRLDGTTLTERIALWGEDWKLLDHGSETDEQLFARGKLSLDELTEQYGASKVLIVSHGAFIGTMLIGLLDEMPAGLLQNTALSILRRDRDRWFCKLYNCTAHLG
jgi:probable phosphoglycerate mutase